LVLYLSIWCISPFGPHLEGFELVVGKVFDAKRLSCAWRRVRVESRPLSILEEGGVLQRCHGSSIGEGVLHENTKAGVASRLGRVDVRCYGVVDEEESHSWGSAVDELDFAYRCKT
jgi:hypothetical protein